jgi:ABC-type glycerol-3-phosphate transport system substrate-binding protein
MLFRKDTKCSACFFVTMLIIIIVFSSVVVAADKVTLNIFAPDQIVSEALIDTVGPMYEKETGVKVIVDIFPYSSCHEKTIIELTSNSDAYDLFVMDSIWSGEVMQSGKAWDISRFTADPNLPELNLQNFSSYSDAYSTLNGTRYGIPLSENTPILIYRKDLFEKYGIAEIKTWDDFYNAAKKLTLDLDNDGKIDIYGTVMTVQEQDPGYSEWTFRLIGFKPFEDGKFIFNDEHKPIFNNPKGIEALERLKSIMPYCPPDTLAYGHGETGITYKEGKIAMLITWQDVLRQMEDPEFSKVVDKNEYVMIPYTEEDHPYGGIASSWTLVINKASKYPEEAYKFMAWLTEGDAYKKFIEAGEPGVAYLPIRNDPEWIKKMPFLKPWQEFSDAITIPTQYSEFTEVQRIIWEEIVAYLADKKSAETALGDAESRVYKLMESAGYYKK